MLYHVAPAESAEVIWQRGLTSSQSQSGHRRYRRAMRELLQDVATDIDATFPARQGAVFFWTTAKAARQYATSRPGSSCIVEVDPAELGEVWVTDSPTVEELFEAVQSEYDRADSGAEQEALANDSGCRSLAEEVVQYSRQWNGDERDRLEVWTPADVPAAAVRDVIR